MDALPVTEYEIRAGVQEAGSSSDDERRVSTADISRYTTLIQHLQTHFQPRLTDFAAAAYNPDINGFELVDETATQYRFRALPEFWTELQSDLNLSENAVRTVQAIYTQRLPTGNGWTPVLVRKPSLYRYGAYTVLAELTALREAGLAPEHAIEYERLKHNLPEPLNPFVSDRGAPSHSPDLDVWDYPEVMSAQDVLRLTPSEAFDL